MDSPVDYDSTDEVHPEFSWMSEAPNEILARIFLYFDVIEQQQLRQVCARWRTVLMSPPVERHILIDASKVIDISKSQKHRVLQCLDRRTPSAVILNIHAPASAPEMRTNLHHVFVTSITRHNCLSLRRIFLSNVSVYYAFLIHTIPRSVRRVTVMDVTVTGLHSTYSPPYCCLYKFSVEAKGTHVIKLIAQCDGGSEDEIVNARRAAVWTLAKDSAEPMNELDMSLLVTSTNTLDNHGQDHVTEIIKRHEPFSKEYAVDWSLADFQQLHPLTLQEISAYITKYMGF